MTEALTQCGHEVVVAQRQADAIAIVAGKTLDLVVLDIQIPDTSGLELAAVLRDRFSLPFMFLTLVEDEATVHQATEAGALAYLVRSANLRQLLPSIEAALARAEELKKLRQAEASLSAALQQGREVSIAVGVLMERFRLNFDTALEMLRDNARARRQRLHDLATELLEATERLNSLRRERIRHSVRHGSKG